MAMTRKYGRKRTVRRRAPARGRVPRKVYRPVKRMIQNNVYSFKRMIAGGGTITGNAIWTPYTAISVFAFNQMVNASDFGSLFDQYRITYVVQKFWLQIDPSAQSAAGASYPKFYWYRDYDDSTTPSSLNEMRENGRTRVVVMNPNRPVTVAFKPNTLNNVWNTGLTTATQSPVWGQWLDMANLNTTHYGFKYAIDDLTNVNYKVQVETTFYFQCKSVR